MTRQKESLGLTPAESLMILDPEKDRGKEMMKFTLIDLLLRKALEVEVRQEKKGKVLKRDVKQTYIKRGEAYCKLALKPHEEAFCRPLESRESLDLKDLAKEVHETVKGFKGYRDNLVREPLAEQGYFGKEKRKRLLIPYSKYTLTQKGQEVQQKMTHLIKEGEDNLEEWMSKDMAKAKAYLFACGANIFLLSNCDLETIRTWMKQLAGLESGSLDYAPYPFSWYGYESIHLEDGVENFHISAMDFDTLSGFDSLDDFDSGFDGPEGGYDD